MALITKQNKSPGFAFLYTGFTFPCVGFALGQPFFLWHRLQQLQAHILPAQQIQRNRSCFSLRVPTEVSTDAAHGFQNMYYHGQPGSSALFQSQGQRSAQSKALHLKWGRGDAPKESQSVVTRGIRVDAGWSKYRHSLLIGQIRLLWIRVQALNIQSCLPSSPCFLLLDFLP